MCGWFNNPPIKWETRDWSWHSTRKYHLSPVGYCSWKSCHTSKESMVLQKRELIVYLLRNHSTYGTYYSERTCVPFSFFPILEQTPTWQGRKLLKWQHLLCCVHNASEATWFFVIKWLCIIPFSWEETTLNLIVSVTDSNCLAQY